jgi:Helicase associated domain
MTYISLNERSFPKNQHRSLSRRIVTFFYGYLCWLPLFLDLAVPRNGNHRFCNALLRQETILAFPWRISMQLEKSCYESTTQCVPDVPLQTSRVVKVGWDERYRQLSEFRQVHGHAMVPKRYKANPSLGNWVSKQRQHYHNYLTGTKPCSLTNRRIALLNQLQFCWNATLLHSYETKRERDHEKWWAYFEELSSFCAQNQTQLLPRNTRLGIWLNRQRKVYLLQNQLPMNQECHNECSVLSEEQILSLTNLDPDWWMTRRQWQWVERFRDLQRFATLHGHCCVPISFSDKPLAHWVSNQRKQFNLREAGKPSELTPSRIQKLESIGFVWNRWDYEFDKKHVYWR